ARNRTRQGSSASEPGFLAPLGEEVVREANRRGVSLEEQSARLRRVRLEGQRQAVDAVPLAGGWRAVVEDMAEMSAAAPAMDLRADLQQRTVFVLADGVRQRFPEAWPARAGIEFRLRGIKGKIAAGAMEDTDSMLVEKRAGEGRLGALLPQDIVLVGRQD